MENKIRIKVPIKTSEILKCSKCKHEKNKSEFINNQTGKITKMCDDCRAFDRNRDKERKKKNNEKFETYKSIDNKKICKSCKKELLLSDFKNETNKYCNSCLEHAANDRKNRIEREKKKAEESNGILKFCSGCRKAKDINLYKKEKSNIILNVCESCRK
jgi:hypothetical protein